MARPRTGPRKRSLHGFLTFAVERCVLGAAGGGGTWVDLDRDDEERREKGWGGGGRTR